MIQEDEIVPLLVQTYPGFRKRLIEEIEVWFSDDGRIMLHSVLSVLCSYIVERFEKGDFEGGEDLFNLIERFMNEGGVHVRYSGGLSRNPRHYRG